MEETVREMLNDRGYTQVDMVEPNLILVATLFEPGNHLLVRCKLLVHYLENIDKINVKIIKQIQSLITTHACNKLILIYKCNVTTFAKQYIQSEMQNVEIQYFYQKELMFNLTKHALVPRHILLDETEKREILNKYKCPLKNFPFIRQSDPVCKYYDFVPGQMIKIIRPSETSGEYVMYRVVVK